jgi:uncharacterized protein (TIGR03435 family)
VVTVLAAGFGHALDAQVQPAFEVASIHPSPDGLPTAGAGVQITPRQFRAGYLSLKDYISIAYGVRLHQIAGPEWIASARFDIVATMPEGSTGDLADMMRRLLAERFQLRTHREQRDFDVYALEQSKNGPSLVPLPDDTPANATFTAGSSSDGNAIAADLGNGASLSFANSKFEARRVTMTALGDTLGRFLDRPIVDRTGLTGRYDVIFEVAADDYYPMLVRSGVNAGIPMPPQAMQLLERPSTGSVPDALRRMGLSLESRRTPLEVLVVDHIERAPTMN